MPTFDVYELTHPTVVTSLAPHTMVAVCKKGSCYSDRSSIMISNMNGFDVTTMVSSAASVTLTSLVGPLLQDALSAPNYDVACNLTWAEYKAKCYSGVEKDTTKKFMGTITIKASSPAVAAKYIYDKIKGNLPRSYRMAAGENCWEVKEETQKLLD